MDISAKYSSAHSHAWATGHSILHSCSRDRLRCDGKEERETNYAKAARRTAPDLINCTEATLDEGVILSIESYT